MAVGTANIIATTADGGFTADCTVIVQASQGTVTVIFNSMGGSPIPEQTITIGSRVAFPAEPSKTGEVFEGWYTTDTLTAKYDFDSPVTTPIVLYAKWITKDEADFGAGAIISQTFTVRNATDWAAAVAAIIGGGNGKKYVINISAGFDIVGSTSRTFDYVTDIVVSIRGIGATNPRLGLLSSGNVLYVSANQTVILRDITLWGRTSNSSPLINISGTAAILEMKGSAAVSGNTSPYSGVHVHSGGIFTMRDKTMVSGNKATSSSDGGGVYVDNNGTFTMWDSAAVSGNTATLNGGGVYVSKGTFDMYGNAKVSDNSSFSGGGGVYLHINATLTMQGNAKVSDNSATPYGGGGGVSVSATNAVFIMKDNAVVSGNTAPAGGVSLDHATAIFTMQDSAAVSGNTATSSGGGVYIGTGTFTMRDSAVVSGNTAASSGGGVYANTGVFRMAGGTVYGYAEGDPNSNAVKNGQTALSNWGAALSKNTSAAMQYGTVTGDVWNNRGNIPLTVSGSDAYRDTTITVINGILQ